MMFVTTSHMNAIHLIPLDVCSRYFRPTTTTPIEPIKSSTLGLALANLETISTHQMDRMNTAITALYYKIST